MNVYTVIDYIGLRQKRYLRQNNQLIKNVMANPALKNGYVSIATELVEKFATLSIPSSEMRIVWVVWRKTWGWKDGDRHKDWDWISLSQFEKLTTMKHGNVAKSLKSLVVKRILLKKENSYKFNQNYDEWVVVKRLPPVVKRILPSSQTTTKSSSQTHTNNRNKETNTIDIYGGLRPQDVSLFINSFKEVNPSYQRLFGNTTEIKASVRLIQKYSLDKMISTANALQEIITKPYAPRITTPYELEKNLGKLLAFIEQNKNIIKEKKPKIAFT